MTDEPPTVERRLREYDLFDGEIVAHGFLPYLRDYRLIIHRPDDAPLRVFEYVFVGCMEARYAVTLPPGAISMDARLLDPEAGDAPGGAYRWSVGSARSTQEGVTLSRTTERAAHWTARLGRPMFEIVIGTDVFELALVFHDLVIRPAAVTDV